MKKVPLTYPLPRRECVTLADGRWYSREWTPLAREMAEAERVKLVREASDGRN